METKDYCGNNASNVATILIIPYRDEKYSIQNRHPYTYLSCWMHISVSYGSPVDQTQDGLN